MGPPLKDVGPARAEFERMRTTIEAGEAERKTVEAPMRAGGGGAAAGGGTGEGGNWRIIEVIQMRRSFTQQHIPAARLALEGLRRLSHGLVAGMCPAGLGLAVEVEQYLAVVFHLYPWVAHMW